MNKKFNFAIDKSAIGEWTNETDGQELIEKAILKAESIAFFPVITGVKYKKDWKFLSTNALIQAGSCGTPTTSGTTTLTNKEISVKPYFVYEEMCPEDLNDTALSLMESPGYQEDVPFKQQYAGLKSKGIAKNEENKFWVSISGATQHEGILNQLAKDSDVHTYTFDFSATGTTDANLILAYRGMIELIPAELQDADDLYLCIGHEEFRKLSVAFLNTANVLMSKFDFNGVSEFVFPGAENIKVKPLNGLNAANNTDHIALITKQSNFAYVTDMDGEAENADLWFSKDDRVFKFLAKWKSGAAYQFGDYVVMSKKS